MDSVSDDVVDGLALDLGGLQGIQISRLVGDGSLSDLLSIGLELVIHTDEVRLAVQLDNGTGLAVSADDSQSSALIRGAAGLLRNGGQTRGTQDVNGLFHVAFSLDQSLLAFHHSSSGHLAELLYHSSLDFSHG